MRRPCTNRYPCKRLGKRCGTLASSLAHMWAAPPPNTPGKKHFQTGPYLPPHCYLNHWESSPLLEFLCRLPLAPLPAPWCKLEPPPRGTHSLSPFMFKFLPGDQVRISRSNQSPKLESDVNNLDLCPNLSTLLAGHRAAFLPCHLFFDVPAYLLKNINKFSLRIIWILLIILPVFSSKK